MGCGVYITNIELDYNYLERWAWEEGGVYITNIELDYNFPSIFHRIHNGVYITNIELDYNCIDHITKEDLVFISLILN